MSEGSNLPRNPVKNQTWLHSEPARRTIQRLADPDFVHQIINARRDLTQNVARVLTFSEESTSETDAPAHVVTECEFNFDEIDQSLLPATQRAENNNHSRSRRRDRIPSNSTASNVSQRGEYSLTSYESSVFDPAESNYDAEMAIPPTRASPMVTSHEIDREINRLREEIENRPGPSEPNKKVGETNHTTERPIDNAILLVVMEELKELRQKIAEQERLPRVTQEIPRDETYQPRRTLANEPTPHSRLREARELVPAFDGASEEKLREFLRACSYAFQLIDPMDEYTLVQAIICTKLKDRAMVELENREVSTYAQLQEILENAYAKKKSVIRLQREFNFVKQRVGEEARTFGNRVDRLATELYESSTDGTHYSPAQKLGIFEYIKTQALINYQLGLNDQLRTIVRSRAPTTLAEAIAGAVEEERINGISINKPRANEYNRTHNATTRPSRSHPIIKCHKCGKIGHDGRECRTSRYANRFSLPKPETTPRVNVTDKYCTYCKRNGHLREECWNLHGKPKTNNKNKPRTKPSRPFINATEKTNRNQKTNNSDSEYESDYRNEKKCVREYRINQVRTNPLAYCNLDVVLMQIEEVKYSKIPLLIDTGSCLSLIKIRNLTDDLPMTKENLTLTGITGHKTQTLGKVIVTLKFGNKRKKQKLYVVKDSFPIEYEGIIGLNCLKAHGMVCDYVNNKLRTPGDDLPLLPLQTYIVPARSEMLVRAIVNSRREGIIHAKEIKPGIFIGNSVVKSENYTCPATIMNTTEQTIELAAPYVIVKNVPEEEEYATYYTSKATDYSSSAVMTRIERVKQLLRLTHLNSEEQKAILIVCEEFSDTFFLEGDKLTYTKCVEHRVTTRADSAPVNVRPYRLPHKHKQEVDRQIAEMLSQEIIQPSVSQWNAPLLVVPKKPDAHGVAKLRVVVDFRKLNDLTIGDSFPLPNISEILDQLGNAKYFTTLDLAAGYHQISMEKGDREKTAFSTPTGHYEFNRMPFGLKNAPATFQRLMNTILTGLQGIRCLVYLDDIVIYGSSLEEHNKRLKAVLQRLRRSNLKLQPEKCEFLRKEVTYLGHIISERGILPDTAKIEAVTKFPTPTKVKHVQSFIGLAGYYRRFIQNFSKIIRPLTKLTKKEAKFEWNPEQELAFKIIKEKLTTAPVLIYPDFEKEFLVTTDASDYAIGAILSQGKIGEDKPIAYASRILSRAEQNYSTTEKELLAIVWAVKYFRPYVYGTKFKIITDHKPLEWLFKVKDPGSRLIRWRLKLEEYDYEIIYKAGKTNVNADALSRYPPVSMLKAKRENSDEENISNELENEKDEKGNIREYTEEEKKQILYEYHDAPLGGHQGIQRTLKRMQLKHNWKGMIADVVKYISKCDLCQRNKITRKNKAPMIITDTPENPFEKCALDIVGPLTITQKGNKYLLTFQDSLTKFSKAMPIPNQEATTVAKEFVEKIVLEYGIPEKILTDQGTNFLSNIFKSVCKLLKIEKIQTTAYHPQSNGALERSHRTLAEYLRHYINEDQTDWDEWIPYAIFTYNILYNTTPHSSTNYTPYELVYGRQANVPSALLQPPKPAYTFDDYAQEIKQKIRATNKLAREHLKEEKEKSKKYYDKKTKQTNYQIGDQVLLFDETVRRGRSKKLDSLWIGPYEVIKVHEKENYTIKRGRKTLRVHANRLKLYIED